MWEYRMFLADKQESDKIFSALGGDAAAQTLDRSDVYVAVGDSLGLKLRGGRDGLECKLRLARKKRGAERWVKGLVDTGEAAGSLGQQQQAEAVTLGADTLARVRAWVVQQAEEDPAESRKALDDLASCVRPDQPLRTLTVHKQVQKGKTAAGLTVERTRVSSDSFTPSWTVCVETKKAASSIYDALAIALPTGSTPLSAVSNDVDPRSLGSIAMGYPAFVARHFRMLPLTPSVDPARVLVGATAQR